MTAHTAVSVNDLFLAASLEIVMRHPPSGLGGVYEMPVMLRFVIAFGDFCLLYMAPGRRMYNSVFP